MRRHQRRRYPIRPAQVVAVGKHRVLAFDLVQQLPTLRALLGEFAPTLVYTDPPWGPALHSRYRQRAGVPHEDVDYARFIRCCADLVTSFGVPWVVEMGNSWVPLWLQALGAHATRPPVIVAGTYYRSRPMSYLLHGTRSEVVALTALDGVDDLQAPGVAMDALGLGAQDTVFDPCCGVGITAHHALARDVRFVGNEFNPTRCAQTLCRLHDGG